MSTHNYVSSRNKKNNVYPCKPQFYYIKVGFKGVKIIKACFRDVCFTSLCVVHKLQFVIHIWQNFDTADIFKSLPMYVCVSIWIIQSFDNSN